jgi:hypothetical protein
MLPIYITLGVVTVLNCILIKMESCKRKGNGSAVKAAEENTIVSKPLATIELADQSGAAEPLAAGGIPVE